MYKIKGITLDWVECIGREEERGNLQTTMSPVLCRCMPMKLFQ
ncbi:hypothetical protein MtrunA17_Chr1g0178551 [Medicago truncatula]|uniref:Uncharacterized protein n=1 Tax=Medicago truncatula TaxID=3880 RepID=A0A396JY09_MEDTR|nr:hypothetical protein MtrunA17_Chr1g0178551 [Medicago truncatula]